MLHFHNEGKEIHISFYHVCDENDVQCLTEYHLGESQPNIKAITCCFLEVGKTVTDGWAACSIEDNFDRKIGRKLSLTRALQGYDKKFRTLVWEKYFEVSKF